MESCSINPTAEWQLREARRQEVLAAFWRRRAASTDGAPLCRRFARRHDREAARLLALVVANTNETAAEEEREAQSQREYADARRTREFTQRANRGDHPEPEEWDANLAEIRRQSDGRRDLEKREARLEAERERAAAEARETLAELRRVADLGVERLTRSLVAYRPFPRRRATPRAPASSGRRATGSVGRRDDGAPAPTDDDEDDPPAWLARLERGLRRANRPDGRRCSFCLSPLRAPVRVEHADAIVACPACAPASCRRAPR